MDQSKIENKSKELQRVNSEKQQKKTRFSNEVLEASSSTGKSIFNTPKYCNVILTYLPISDRMDRASATDAVNSVRFLIGSNQRL